MDVLMHRLRTTFLKSDTNIHMLFLRRVKRNRITRKAKQSQTREGLLLGNPFSDTQWDGNITKHKSVKFENYSSPDYYNCKILTINHRRTISETKYHGRTTKWTNNHGETTSERVYFQEPAKIWVWWVLCWAYNFGLFSFILLKSDPSQLRN